MDYEQMLAKAQKELPESVSSGERFQIEKVSGHLEGNKTIISNLKKIADRCGRPPEHLLKYLQRELASPAKFDGERTIFGTKIASEFINKKVKQYISEFVLCPACGKPDTKLLLAEDVQYLKCDVCGNKVPVKRIR